MCVLLWLSCVDCDPSLDWTLRHGRSMALSVALKDAPQRIWTESQQKSVFNAIGKLVAADRVIQISFKVFNEFSVDLLL